MATQQAFAFADGAVVGTLSYDDATQLASSLTCANTTEQPVSYEIWCDGGYFYQGTFAPGIDSATFDPPLDLTTMGTRVGWAA